MRTVILLFFAAFATSSTLAEERPVRLEDLPDQAKDNKAQNSKKMKILTEVRRQLAERSAKAGDTDEDAKAAVVETDLRICFQEHDFYTREATINRALAAEAGSVADQWEAPATQGEKNDFQRRLDQVDAELASVRSKPRDADTSAEIAALESRRARILSTLAAIRSPNSGSHANGDRSAAIQQMRGFQKAFTLAAEKSEANARLAADECRGHYNALLKLADVQAIQRELNRWRTTMHELIPEGSTTNVTSVVPTREVAVPVIINLQKENEQLKKTNDELKSVLGNADLLEIRAKEIRATTGVSAPAR